MTRGKPAELNALPEPLSSRAKGKKRGLKNSKPKRKRETWLRKRRRKDFKISEALQLLLTKRLPRIAGETSAKAGQDSIFYLQASVFFKEQRENGERERFFGAGMID